MSLSSASRRRRRTPTALNQLMGSQGTELPAQFGDPDFSLSETPGSQLQFPGNAATSRVQDVKTRATNQLNAAAAAGIDTSGGKYDQLRRAAGLGTTKRERSLGESMLGWLGAPFEFIQLAFQDTFQEGGATASIADYANTLWGGIEDREEFAERTGLKPWSGSETLTMFGWEPAENFGPEAALRGIFDFGFSMVTDPLTYLTGGLAGLGRKAAMTGARRFQFGVARDLRILVDDGKNLVQPIVKNGKIVNAHEVGNVSKEALERSGASPYVKELGRTRKKTIDDFTEEMGEHFDDIAQGNMDNPVVAQLNRYLGGGSSAKFGDDVFKNWEELAMARRISREVVEPLSGRNFAAVSAIAIKELPMWMRGGLRLGPPAFSRRLGEIGVEIPGTRGLGRKLVGNPMRKLSDGMKEFSPKYKKIADAMSSGRLSFDAYRPLMNGLRDGTLPAWQFHIAATAIDNVNNQHFRQQVTATLAHHGKVLGEAADSALQDRDEVMRTVLERLGRSSDDIALMEQAQKGAQMSAGGKLIHAASRAADTRLEKLIDEAVEYMRGVKDEVADAMAELDPKFRSKYVDGYVDHIYSQDGRDILNQFVRKGANVPRAEWADAAERGEPGKSLLVRIMHTMGGGGSAETSLGSSRFVEPVTGRLQMQSIADDGPLLFDESYLTDLLLRQQSVPIIGPGGQVADPGLKTGFASVAQLNEWLEVTIRENAERYGIKIPKNWDGKLFKENPLEIMAEYTAAMDDTIKQWTMVDAMKQAGLVVQRSTAIDVQDVLQKMMANINRISKKVPVEQFYQTSGITPPPLGRQATTVTIGGKKTAFEWTLPDGTVFHAGNVAQVGLDPQGNRRVLLNVVDESGNVVDRILTPAEIESLGGIKELGRAQEAVIRASEKSGRGGAGARLNAEEIGDLLGASRGQAPGQIPIPKGVVDEPAEWVRRIADDRMMSSKFGDLRADDKFVTINVDDQGMGAVTDGFRLLQRSIDDGATSIPVKYTRGARDFQTMSREVDLSEHLINKPKAFNLKDPSGVAPTEEAIQVSQQLADDAMKTWANVGGRIRKIINRFVEGPSKRIGGAESGDTQKALALMHEFNTQASPVRDQVGGIAADDRQVTRVARKEPDSVLRQRTWTKADEGFDMTIDMESAGWGEHTFLKDNDSMTSKDKAWVYVFDESDPVLKNPHSQAGENEVFVSGKFRVREVDPETKHVFLERTDDVLPAVDPATAPTPGLEGTVLKGDLDASDLFLTRPSQAAAGSGGATADPGPREINILPEMQEIVDAVPRSVIEPMNAAGMDPTDIRGTRELYQTIEGLTEEQFGAIRKATQQTLPGTAPVGTGLRIEAREGVWTVGLHLDPSMSYHEVEQLKEAAIHTLDAAFKDGHLKGQLNHKTMVRLAEEAPNEETSALLHKFYRTKMTNLPDNVRNYLGKNPGDFTEIGVLADEMYRGVNEFMSGYSAKMASTGELVQGGRQARQLADDIDSDVARDLADLHKAARELADRGYDEALEVMRRVEDVTGVTDLPNYIKPHALGIGGPAVENMVIQRDIALWLKNVSRNTASIYTPEGVAAAKLATNNLLRTWRALATLPRPAFHIRNAVGAAWMNMAVGVKSETYFRLSSNTLKWRKALREGVENPYEVLDRDIVPAWRAMVEADVLSGFVSSEFRNPLTGIQKRNRMKFLNFMDPEDFVATRVGGRVMESIEDVARASLFLEYFEEGVEGSAQMAREMVHAVHFDYSNLTPLETKIKSWIPFFVWTRRNLPRQLEMMVERPGLIERYRHMMQAMNDNLGGDSDPNAPTGDNFSAYAAGTSFYVNDQTPFWARMMIDPDLPTSDLLQIPNPNPGEIADFANNLLGPHVSGLFDLNSQREFGDVNAPAAMQPITKGLAAIGMFDETLDGDVRIPYWLRTIQETALPFTRDLVDPFTGGPSDPNRQQRLGISQDDKGLESSLKNIIASLGRGVGAKFNTPVDVRAAAYRSQTDLDALIKSLRGSGDLPPGGQSKIDSLFESLGG